MDTWINLVQCDHTLCDQFSCNAFLDSESSRRAFFQYPRILRAHKCLYHVVVVHSVSHAVASTAHASRHECGALKQSSKERGGLGSSVESTKRASVDGGPE